MKHPPRKFSRRVGRVVCPVYIDDLGLFNDSDHLFHLSEIQMFCHIGYHGQIIPYNLKDCLVLLIFTLLPGLLTGQFLLPLLLPHSLLKGRPAFIPCCLQHADNGGLPHAGPLCQFPHSYVPGRLRIFQKQICRFFLVPAQHGIAEPQFSLPHICHSLVRNIAPFF